MPLLMQAKSRRNVDFLRHIKLILKEKPNRNIATSSSASTENLVTSHELTSEAATTTGTSATEKPRSPDNKDHGNVDGASGLSGVVGGAGRSSSVARAPTTTSKGKAELHLTRLPVQVMHHVRTADSRYHRKLRYRKYK